MEKVFKFKGGSFKVRKLNLIDELKFKSHLVQNIEGLDTFGITALVLEKGEVLITEVKGAKDYEELLAKPQAKEAILDFATHVMNTLNDEIKKKAASKT